jgi:cytochrome c oxidase subunit 2
MRRVIVIAGWIVTALLGVAVAGASPITNWLQNPATPIADAVRRDFWNTALLVSPFLLIPQILLIYSMIRFRASRRGEASKVDTNVKLEIVWTIVPVITLILVGIPAYHTLEAMNVPPKSDLVVEVIGHQFFWEYRYPRYGIDISNEPMVVPANKVVTINATSVDVIHAWWVPAFGVKQDANPGRITNTWFRAAPGKYKGQCAELCGTLHGQMFIDVTVLPEAEFEDWVRQKTGKEIPVDATSPQALLSVDTDATSTSGAGK